jgi:hypothetical protein
VSPVAPPTGALLALVERKKYRKNRQPVGQHLLGRRHRPSERPSFAVARHFLERRHSIANLLCALGCTDLTMLNARRRRVARRSDRHGPGGRLDPCRHFNPEATAEARHLCCALPSKAEAKVFCSSLLRRLGRERALALMPFGCFDIDGKAVLVFFKTLELGATEH